MARLETLNTGKAMRESRWDMADVARVFRYYADLADKALKVAQLHAMEAGVANLSYRSVAASRGSASTAYFSTTINGLDVREAVAALPPGFEYRGGVNFEELGEGGALQISTPLTGPSMPRAIRSNRDICASASSAVIGRPSTAKQIGMAMSAPAAR